MSDVGLREQVLESCRALAAHGLGPGIGGHVSVRVPGKQLYWTNVLDKTFEEMRLNDIVLLDFDGNAVEADRPVSPGIGFHHGIYKLREDINSVVHTHGFWITAQSAMCRAPRMLHNMSTYFYNKVAIAPDDDIDAIAPAMKPGDNTIIIPWHGSITLGRDIAEATVLHQTLDYCSRMDITVPETAPEMPADHAAAVQKLLMKANYIQLTWDLMRRKARRAHNGEVVVPLIAA